MFRAPDRDGVRSIEYISIADRRGVLIESSDKKIMAIIPARGGSKRVPRKNLALLAGKPLIAWTIEKSLRCQCIDRVIVSTEDAEIADISRKCGADVPFMRPTELSRDNTPDLPVCRHALEWMAEHENYHPDIIAWLRPTCPLRRVEDIRSAVEKLIETKADCVRSVSCVKHHPYWMKRLKEDRLIPFMDNKNEKEHYQRQLLPELYHLNGAVDVVWAENVLKEELLFAGDMRAYVMPPEFSEDIDTELDFAIVEAILERYRV
jgi:CMP-N,N'-diacetyllegionaminic acid synthase